MVNKIRRFLLVIVVTVVGLVGFQLYKNLGSSIGNVKLKVMGTGIDIEIENFKVVHEVEGKKEWELKADLAQINKKEQTTRLKNIELKMKKSDNREFRISADSGILRNDTKDFDLQGHVKLVGPPRILMERFQKQPEEPAQ